VAFGVAGMRVRVSLSSAAPGPGGDRSPRRPQLSAQVWSTCTFPAASHWSELTTVSLIPNE
jgi:hypothetical protein